ncbi:MAG: P-loop NTPase, partial [Acholeplasmataceae bacterium]
MANKEIERSNPLFMVKPHELSHIKKIIGVVSGKGGVGKSTITALLAVTMNQLGYHSAIFDADITGPSIPKMFGVTEKVVGNEHGIFPMLSETGIDLISTNLILENENEPVLWRGPILASVIKQFWSEVMWGDVDYLFIDMPPGTGDIPLTVYQSIPLDGVIMITSPQQLVSMIVAKA